MAQRYSAGRGAFHCAGERISAVAQTTTMARRTAVTPRPATVLSMSAGSGPWGYDVAWVRGDVLAAVLVKRPTTQSDADVLSSHNGRSPAYKHVLTGSACRARRQWPLAFLGTQSRRRES